MGRDVESEAVRVMVRVRPFNSKEITVHEAHDAEGTAPQSIVVMQKSNEMVSVLDEDGCFADSFDFTKVYWSIPGHTSSRPFADQADVYQDTGRVAVDTALNARHCCVFAYGQTGSGKSYTMLGSQESPGVAPRIVDDVFARLDAWGWKKDGFEYGVDVSFMEIYNEKVKDLLVGHGSEAGEKPRKKKTRKVVRKRGGSTSPPPAGDDRDGESPRAALAPPASAFSGMRSRAGSSKRPLLAESPPRVRGGSVRSRDGGSPSPRPRSNTKQGAAASPRRQISRGSSAVSSDDEDYEALRVRNSPLIGVYIEGLTRLGKDDGLTTAAEVKRIMRAGMEHRATAETQMNSTSSRSHAIFQICIRSKNDAKGITRHANINIVDLAGSEKIKMSKVEGQQFVEATNINLSLSTLRRVIDILIENQKGGKRMVPPFRESILTYILSESLGGNSVTMMVATVSPAEGNRDDTISTLRYANKAKNIVNKVRQNEQRCNVMLSAMQQEMVNLRAQLASNDASSDNAVKLREDLERAEQQAAAQEAARERVAENIEHVQEELRQAEAEAQQAEAELRALNSEHVTEKHEAALKDQEDIKRALEKKQSLARLRAEESRKLSARLAEEQMAQAELQRQRSAHRLCLAGHRQSLIALRQRQFYTAFQKAFALSGVKRRAEERASVLRDAKEDVAAKTFENERLSQAATSAVMQNTHLRRTTQTLNDRSDAQRARIDAMEVQKLAEVSRLQDAVERATAQLEASIDDSKEAKARVQGARQLARREAAAHDEKLLMMRRQIDQRQHGLVEKRANHESLRSQQAGLLEDIKAVEEQLVAARAELNEQHARVAHLRVEVKLERGLEDMMMQEHVKTNESLTQAQWDVDGLQSKKETTKVVLDLLKSEHDELKQYAMNKFFKGATVVEQRDRTPSQRIEALSGNSFVDGERAWLGQGCAYMRNVHRTGSRSPSRSPGVSPRGVSPGVVHRCVSDASANGSAVLGSERPPAPHTAGAAGENAGPDAAPTAPAADRTAVPIHVQDCLRVAGGVVLKSPSPSRPFYSHVGTPTSPPQSARRIPSGSPAPARSIATAFGPGSFAVTHSRRSSASPMARTPSTSPLRTVSYRSAERHERIVRKAPVPAEAKVKKAKKGTGKAPRTKKQAAQ